MFAAQKLVNNAGFQLAPRTSAVVDPTKQPGAIADQSPRAGAKAKRGSIVTVAVYTGTGRVAVPSVLGTTPGLADQALRASQLTLGAVSPQPLDPDRRIRSQIPLPGTKVAAGTAVAVFMAPAGAPARRGDGRREARYRGCGRRRGRGSHGGRRGATPAALAAVAAQAGKGPIAIPALSGDPTAAAGKLSQLGLVPVPTKRLATVPVGRSREPCRAAGAKVPKGAQVDLLISSGSPRLAYDDGHAIHVIDPTTGKPAGRVPAGAGPDVEASWSPDGTHLVVSDGGRLVLEQPNAPAAAPFALTPPTPGVEDLNPAFAPTTKALIVAFVQRSPGGARLCFATIGRFALNADCTAAPGWDLGGEVDWSPDGSTILVLGTPQPRRELRAARLHEQRPVLDARRRLGARHPPDERLGGGPGRVRGRVLARRKADGARLEHRQLGLPPLRRSGRDVLAPAGAATAGPRVPGELALGRSRARGHAAGRPVQPDRDRHRGRRRSVQSADSDHARYAGRASAVATGGQWWLTWHSGSGSSCSCSLTAARVPIEGQLTIGRAEDATVRLDDPTVSRRHARIVPGPDGPVIEDAGSRFGVLVDGQTAGGAAPVAAGGGDPARQRSAARRASGARVVR